MRTCSTIDAKRPRAIPCSSARVITALPSFTTSRRAYFSCDRSENEDPFTDCESAACNARFKSNCVLWNKNRVILLAMCFFLGKGGSKTPYSYTDSWLYDFLAPHWRMVDVFAFKHLQILKLWDMIASLRWWRPKIMMLYVCVKKNKMRRHCEKFHYFHSSFLLEREV